MHLAAPVFASSSVGLQNLPLGSDHVDEVGELSRIGIKFGSCCGLWLHVGGIANGPESRDTIGCLRGHDGGGPPIIGTS